MARRRRLGEPFRVYKTFGEFIFEQIQNKQVGTGRWVHKHIRTRTWAGIRYFAVDKLPGGD